MTTSGASDRSFWQQWHDDYADPRSDLARRLQVVVRLLGAAVDSAPPGPVRLLSLCAGEGRDVVGALAGHPRAGGVTGRLVELDPDNASVAEGGLRAAGLSGLEVVVADAGTTDAYAGLPPADVLLLCGIFGNVPEADVQRTVAYAPRLCAPGATVVWTRHRRPPDLTPAIRGWFAAAGFAETAFEGPADASYGVGAGRLVGPGGGAAPGVRLFSFTRGGRPPEPHGRPGVP